MTSFSSHPPSRGPSLPPCSRSAFPWCRCDDYSATDSPYGLTLTGSGVTSGAFWASFTVGATEFSPSQCASILSQYGIEKIQVLTI